jgi:hypothetical protein
MAASASMNPGTNQMAVIAAGNTADFKQVSMGETLTFVRDVVVVLGLQVAFRTMMLLRKLNY